MYGTVWTVKVGHLKKYNYSYNGYPVTIWARYR